MYRKIKTPFLMDEWSRPAVEVPQFQDAVIGYGQACLLELKLTSGEKTAEFGMLRTSYRAARCGNRSVSTFRTTPHPARSRAVCAT